MNAWVWWLLYVGLTHSCTELPVSECMGVVALYVGLTHSCTELSVSECMGVVVTLCWPEPQLY